MLETNRQQAALPVGCTILNNDFGTAAGMWFEEKGKVFISLPGVPYEMKGIMTDEAIPRLKDKFSLKSIYHRTALTQGIGESFLAEIIKDWENSIREKGLGLAYLPSPGLVKLRITSYKGAEDANVIDAYFEQLAGLIPEALFGFENDTLPSVIGKLLKEKAFTIGTVESCTAGLLANQISSISGASDYFQGSLLTYSNRLKENLANVSIKILADFGFGVKVLVRSQVDFQNICSRAPQNWINNDQMKCDVLFLWEEMQGPDTIKMLNLVPDVDIAIYESGAIIWTVNRENYAKSAMQKFIKSPVYPKMTARNINTTRKILEIM
jgi:nicotinamide-nucleotide amidase